MVDLVFLKLGGSLLTDKTRTEAIRQDVLKRLANEIAEARYRREELRLVLGHGSGSFGHVAAAKFNTRLGVSGPEQWAGFAEVSDAAARLNRYVIAELLEAGIPAIALSPSASAVCHDGRLVHLASEPIRAALDSGLVPVVYGDVAFDSVRGGTIISTEEILDFLAYLLKPQRLLLAGETPGVLDRKGTVIPLLTPPMLPEFWPILGG
jgi:isopentenyl phosphate kinase